MTETVERDIIDLTARPGQQAEPAEAPAPEADSGGESSIPPEELERLTDDIVTALKSVYDPEIPVDIYELGLIYKVDISDDRDATITMTLTAPGCGMGPIMAHDIKTKIEALREVDQADIQMVFDPPWDASRMTEEARLEAGLF